MQIENNENHENLKIQSDNNKNHANQKIIMRIHKIMKILEFQARIMKTNKIL